MLLLFRLFLVGLIIYLLLRSFFKNANSGNKSPEDNQKTKNGKRISKDTGEIIDYEEMKK
jgi:hypothetical protein